MKTCNELKDVLKEIEAILYKASDVNNKRQKAKYVDEAFGMVRAINLIYDYEEDYYKLKTGE